MKYLKLNDVYPYKRAFRLSNFIWELGSVWEFFPKKTLGGQFVEAADSISANIAEGFGRFHKKDKIKFYYYAKGSAMESLDWNEKCKARGLISEEQYLYIFKELNELPKEINILINYTNEKLSR